ncbi:hypothetical protein [Bordetella sp. BOR01]|uniref:hypothetical protein n=1 Tax=Bordetella sp. BOR01 TaxID=2854779 RepID=UPI001C48028F|nr:hypothetical protein [Bordetella sp. BOR01]MBV7482450.1 hypothetical protein [Bordetella sp. BOR01]
MGTAKYDHPGYIADIGPQGTYYVGVWCPHGYPAHVHIGDAAAQADAGLRLRIPDGAFQSLSDDFETLCRRAIGQALESGLLRDGLGGFQETRLALETQPWNGPMQPAPKQAQAPHIALQS